MPLCPYPQARVYDPWFADKLCFPHQPEAVVELYYFDTLSRASSSDPSSMHSGHTSNYRPRSRKHGHGRNQYPRPPKAQKPQQPPRIVSSARTRRRRKFDDRHRDVSALVTFGGFMTASAMTNGFITVKP